MVRSVFIALVVGPAVRVIVVGPVLVVVVVLVTMLVLVVVVAIMVVAVILVLDVLVFMLDLIADRSSSSPGSSLVVGRVLVHQLLEDDTELFLGLLRSPGRATPIDNQNMKKSHNVLSK